MRLAFLFVLLCAGCWDFDSLQSGFVAIDEGKGPEDLAGRDLMCVANALRENCANGIDDNNDCLVDCADPQCSKDPVCQTTSPLGYGQLVTGSTQPACPANTTATGPAPLYDQIDATKQTCHGCTCDPPTACTSMIRPYNKTGCKSGDAQTPTALPPMTGMTCAMVPGGNNFSYSLDTPALNCASHANAAQPDPSWKQQAGLCLDNSANRTCTTLSCIIAQATQLGQKQCVAYANDVSCPAPFTSKTSWFRTYTDGRMCTCACNTPGGACNGSANLNTMSNCMGTNTAITANGTAGCVANNMTMGLSYMITPQAGAACTPAGTATGSAPTLSNQVTICCQP